MATQKIYKNYLFDSNSNISGVTSIHITQDATLADQSVRLTQLTTGLAGKQDTLAAGNALNATSFTAGTLDVEYDDVTIGLSSNELFLKDASVTEAKLDSGVDAETFAVTAHAWTSSGVTGGTIQNVIEQLDAAIQLEKLTIAAGSTNFLSIAGTELSVNSLLITDVTVDTTNATIAAFVAANYTVGIEHQEGDLIVLTAATDATDRTWIHNGGTAVTVADFTKISPDLDALTVRGFLSGGDGIAYNSTTGEIEVDVDGSSLELSAATGAGVVRIKADGVNDTHIDFGTGANQVGADDIPVVDAGTVFTGSTVEEVLNELYNSIAGNTQTLAQTLALGSVTGGNDITLTSGDVLKSSSGAAVLDLRQGGDGVWTVNSDSSSYAQSWIYGTSTVAQLGFGAVTDVSADATSIRMRYTGGDFLVMGQTGIASTDLANLTLTAGSLFIVDNSGGNVSKGVEADIAMFLNSGSAASPTVFNTGVDWSVALGGVGLTVKTANTAYLNQASFQASGNAFDTIVVPSAATADRTQTLQDATGTIALVADIPTDFNSTVTLVASTPLTVTHSLNSTNIHVSIFDSTGSDITAGLDIVRTSVNAITVEANSALANIVVNVIAHAQ